MPNETDLLQIEIALRDARHAGVIMALDRMVIFPTTNAEMKRAMEDMKAVKAFVETNLPSTCIQTAEQLFVEHGAAVKARFLKSKDGGAP